MRLFSHENYSTVLLEMDNSDLNFLAMGTASIVMHMCRSLHDKKGTESVIGILRDHVSWADHGYMNCLIKQVTLLIEIMKFFQSSKETVRMDPKGSLKSALLEFCRLKEQVIQKEKKEMGENWGSATWFYNWNPLKGLEDFD